MSMCEYARKHSTGIHSKASIRCKIIKYLFQIHTEYIPNESQILSTFNQNPFQKWAVARCTGPVFSSTDDFFSATGDVFEASGRAAAPECQKGERAGCFWIPRGEPLWSKSAKKSPGVAPKGSKKLEKAIPKSMQKIMPKKDTKCIPKAFQNDAKTDAKLIDLLCFCEKGWNAPNCLFSNRKRGSGHPRIEKSPSKINGKSIFEKGVQKVMNMVLKRDQNRRPNPIKIHLKIEVDKMTTQNR